MNRIHGAMLVLLAACARPAPSTPPGGATITPPSTTPEDIFKGVDGSNVSLPTSTNSVGDVTAAITGPSTVVVGDRFYLSGLGSTFGNGTGSFSWSVNNASVALCSADQAAVATPLFCAAANPGQSVVTLTINNGAKTVPVTFSVNVTPKAFIKVSNVAGQPVTNVASVGPFTSVAVGISGRDVSNLPSISVPPTPGAADSADTLVVADARGSNAGGAVDSVINIDDVCRLAQKFPADVSTTVTCTATNNPKSLRRILIQSIPPSGVNLVIPGTGYENLEEVRVNAPGSFSGPLVITGAKRIVIADLGSTSPTAITLIATQDLFVERTLASSGSIVMTADRTVVIRGDVSTASSASAASNVTIGYDTGANDADAIYVLGSVSATGNAAQGSGSILIGHADGVNLPAIYLPSVRGVTTLSEATAAGTDAGSAGAVYVSATSSVVLPNLLFAMAGGSVALGTGGIGGEGGSLALRNVLGAGIPRLVLGSPGFTSTVVDVSGGGGNASGGAAGTIDIVAEKFDLVGGNIVARGGNNGATTASATTTGGAGGNVSVSGTEITLRGDVTTSGGDAKVPVGPTSPTAASAGTISIYAFEPISPAVATTYNACNTAAGACATVADGSFGPPVGFAQCSETLSSTVHPPASFTCSAALNGCGSASDPECADIVAGCSDAVTTCDASAFPGIDAYCTTLCGYGLPIPPPCQSQCVLALGASRQACADAARDCRAGLQTLLAATSGRAIFDTSGSLVARSGFGVSAAGCGGTKIAIDVESLAHSIVRVQGQIVTSASEMLIDSTSAYNYHAAAGAPVAISLSAATATGHANTVDVNEIMSKGGPGNAGGDGCAVSISGMIRRLSVSGRIDTSGGSANRTGAAGLAGDIELESSTEGSFTLSVEGATQPVLLANGGAHAGTGATNVAGNGGAGGDVSLGGESASELSVKVGNISAAGGDALVYAAANAAGDGGDVTLAFAATNARREVISIGEMNLAGGNASGTVTGSSAVTQGGAAGGNSAFHFQTSASGTADVRLGKVTKKAGDSRVGTPATTLTVPGRSCGGSLAVQAYGATFDKLVIGDLVLSGGRAATLGQNNSAVGGDGCAFSLTTNNDTAGAIELGAITTAGGDGAIVGTGNAGSGGTGGAMSFVLPREVPASKDAAAASPVKTGALNSSGGAAQGAAATTAAGAITHSGPPGLVTINCAGTASMNRSTPSDDAFGCIDAAFQCKGTNNVCDIP